MKRFTKTCLILGVILLVCGLAVSAAGYVSGAVRDIRAPRSSPTKIEVLDVPAGKLELLDISLSSEDVNFYSSQDGDLHIEYPIRDDVTYEYRDTGDTYQFYSSNSGRGWHWFRIELGFWHRDDSSVNVYLPEGMGVQLSTTSGDVLAQNLGAGQIDISTISGEIELQNLTAGDFGASSTSGSITLGGGTISGSAKCSSTSGEIEMTNTDISGTLSCNTTSGEIDLSGTTVASTESDAANLSSISGDISLATVTIKGGLDLSTTSGEIDLEPATVYGDIDAESTSGDVSLNLTGAPKHRIDHTSSTSGGISVTGGDENGTAGISVSTTSGEIEIRD